MSKEPWEAAGGSFSPEPWEVAQPVAEAKKGEPVRSTLDRVIAGLETVGAPFAKFGEAGANAILHPIDSAKDAAVGLAKGVADMATVGDKAAYRAGLYSTPPQSTKAVDEAYDKACPVAVVTRVVPSAVALGPAGAARLPIDVAANAGYSALEAYGEGRDPVKAALYGGAGAAGGRAVGRTVGPRPNDFPASDQDVRRLLDAGITPTPGQAGGKVAQLVEQGLADYAPGFGASIDAARKRAVGQAAGYEVKRAVAPLGAEITSPVGRKAVQQANDFIEQSYQALIPKTFMTADVARTGALRAGAELDAMPLTDAQKNALATYVGGKVEGLVRAANGGNLNGEAVKAWDSELARLARGASDGAVSDAYYAIRQQMRSVLQGIDEQATAHLRATDQAFKNMIPVNKAAQAAIRKKGVFDPVQFSQKGGGGEVNEAALNVLDTASPSGLGNLIKRGSVVGMGTLAHPLAGAAAYGAGRAGSALLYSEPVVKAMLNTMNLMPNVRAWVNTLSAERQAEFVQRMLEMSATQAGRQLGMQQEISDGNQRH